MSNLSDLLPAGGGAKVITATASGNLATGQTVALQSDGTVKAVSETAGGVGSEYVYESAVTSFGDVTYDSVNNQVIAVYRDEGNSNYGTYVVGTVSGTVITWGTPAVWLSALATDIAIASGNGKLLIAFSDGGNSSYGTVIAGAISGSSISFGTKAVIHSGGQLYETDALYFSPYPDNPTYADRYIVGYSQGGARVNANLIEITGTNTISNGGQYEPNGSSNGGGIGLAYAADQTGKNIILSFKDGSDSNKIKYARASYSAGSPGSLSFGGVGFAATNGNFSSVAWDTSASKVLLAYKSVSSSNELRYQVGTFSGTEDITWETAVTSTATVDTGTRLVYDATANKSVLLYDQDNDSGKGKVAYVSISGTTATIGTIYDFNGGDTSYFNVAYDSTAGVNTIVFTDRGNSEYGTGVVFRDTTSNNTDFAGITNQAINNSASGEVVVEGGVITNSSLIASGVTVGSESVFDTESAAFINVAYDASNNKIVIAYADGGNSNYGTAIVGTVSGSSVTFGSAVVFNSAAVGATSIVYDANAQKVVISYQDGGASNRGRAVVGTVSGTSISFGSEVQFSGASAISTALSSSYDTNAQKVVFVYQDGANSDYGTAVVGTISGTSMTFGSSAVFLTAGPALMDIAYDAGAQKHLIVFQDGGNSNYTTGIVGTVSGTAITFGSKTAINNYNGTNISIAYDSTAAKTVVAYRSIESSPYQPEAVVATISGTSVSFGTKTKDTNFASGVGGLSIAYNPTIDKTLLIVRDEATGTKLGYVLATVSGTGISFGTSAFANADSTSVAGPRNIAYDSSGQKLIACVTNNTDTAGDSYVFSSVTGLTTGSTYYVQDDGTLSTTSSSVTAGKAIANTTLLLKG